MKRRNRFRLPLALLAVSGATLGPAAHADTVVAVDRVQNGGFFSTHTGAVVISGAPNPRFTFTNGASTAPVGASAAVQGVIVGLGGESGQLWIEGGSTFNNNQAGAAGTYDGVAVTRGAGYLGLSTGSTGEATITGAGSNWINANQLYVGYRGTGKLNILSGGLVSNTGTANADRAYVGELAGSTGEVLVSGTNSTWTNGTHIYVGNNGNGKLTVEAGGKVTNAEGHIADVAGSVGEVSVSGAGSTWANSTLLYVGNAGNGKLTIGPGGVVSNTTGYIGNTATSTSEVLVSGAEATWTNSAALRVGQAGNGKLTIEAGGAVSYAGDGNIGFSANSTGEVIVTGAGSTWTGGGQMIVGQTGAGKLTVSAGGIVNANSTTATQFLGNNANSSGEALVTGSGSVWNVASDLVVGRLGTGKLTVSDGGQVAVRTLVASSSDLLGDGAIAARGVVLDGINVVFDATHGLNQSLAFGTGGLLNLNIDGTGFLGAGHKGTGALMIADGVAAASTQGQLGYSTGSAGTATVTGAGSKWTNSAALYVGNAGAGTLNVTAGGAVSNTVAYIGNVASSVGEVVVDGAGSSWTSSEELYVGNNGAGKLTVQNGGSVAARTLLGSLTDLYGNGMISAKGAVLDGANLVFDATHGLTQSVAFGAGGSLNLNIDGTGYLGAGHKGAGSITIADGVTVASTQGLLGNIVGSNGTATVTGAGSTWSNSGPLVIGAYGTGKLNITAGGKVTNTTANLGLRLDAAGEALVSGAGSTWTNTGTIVIGGGVGGVGTIPGYGKITVEAGGTLTNTDATIGSSSGGGDVTVTGAGSTWSSSGRLTVAGNGAIGTLTIAAGANVSSAESQLSSLGTSTGTVLLTGAGSTWATTGELGVGYAGPATMTIENGATATSGAATIARTGTATNAQVVVTGAGSSWTNAGDLTLGGQSEGSQSSGSNGTLTVKDGGKVVVGGILATQTDDVVNLQPGGTIEANYYRISNQSRSGQLNWTGGTLKINGSIATGPRTSNILTVPEGGTLTGGGVVAGAVIPGTSTVTTAGSLTNGGIVAPGNSPGTLTVTGSYTQLSTGTLDIELGGLLAGTEYDRLAVTGNALLDGGLSISLANGFVLDEGQSFTILTAASLSGTFAGLSDGAIVDTFGGYHLVINYGANSVQLMTQAVPEPATIALAVSAVGLLVVQGRRYRKA